MSNVYIIDGARTPIGAYLGQYKKIESVDLGINCVKGLLDRNPIIQKNITPSHKSNEIIKINMKTTMENSRRILNK